MRSTGVALACLCLVVPACGGGETPAERPPQTFTISEGETVTYERGVARPGDTIVCVTPAGRIGAGVGKPETGVSGFGDGPRGAVTIDVVTKDDGSVLAGCSG